MRNLTRAALKRLAVLFVLLGSLILWCWWSMIQMPLRSFRGPLPALTTEQGAARDVMRRHVEKRAGEIGERNVFKPEKLRAAADYIEGTCTNAGYNVNRQSYIVLRETCHNLEATLAGKSRAEEIVVVGADARRRRTRTGSPSASSRRRLHTGRNGSGRPAAGRDAKPAEGAE